MRKFIFPFTLLILIIIYLMLTNPTTDDYLAYSVKQFGESPSVTNLEIEIERVNFMFFSTYTQIVAFETGITYLGIGGAFFKISDGQFDYPWWLEFFN
ncbi:hypothetical protein ACFSCX_12310 [Bacillus salitolerans]|uniref:Uncharacterized protein n=1 Tax=Bacillus salitolerans TaxID=1437434 RepID=A0ABW4LTA9_9BACI